MFWTLRPFLTNTHIWMMHQILDKIIDQSNITKLPLAKCKFRKCDDSDGAGALLCLERG